MNNNLFPGNSYDQWNESPGQETISLDQSYVAKYVTKVYGWMFLGLLLTFGIAIFVASSEAAISFIIGQRIVFYGLIIAQLLLVGFLSIRIQKMSAAVATATFLGYAVLNGLTFSIFFLVYNVGSLVTVFGITAATFGVMSAVGYFTKQDLTSFGRIMLMGLVGIIIASIVNLFLHNPTLYWIISYVGVAVFVGLIAYDTQKIKAYAYLDSEESRKKGAILGALALYLDFINLFIMLLRLFGNRRN